MGKFDSIISDALTIAASAARTAVLTSADFINEKARGLEVYLNITSITAGINEVQEITVDATGGTFTLSFGGQTTSALDWNAAPATIENALRALSTIGLGNCSVAPNGPGVFRVTFIGTLAATNVAEMTADSASLTGNTHTASLTTVTQGQAGTSLTLKIQGQDPVSRNYIDILTGAAVSATGTTKYVVYPGLTAVTNQVASAALPNKFRVVVTPSAADSATYSVGGSLCP